MKVRRIVLWVLLAALMTGTASGQESLQSAKDLYASAAYEDALAVLGRLQRTDSPLEVQQYRAFCLIALGRVDEAERAIELVVSANPKYVPTAMDVSPRIQEVFTRTRNQLLPEIARERYVDAKRALDRKDRDAAVTGFAAVVELIDGASPELREALDELRFLAAGFLDLITAMRPSAPAGASLGASDGNRSAPINRNYSARCLEAGDAAVGPDRCRKPAGLLWCHSGGDFSCRTCRVGVDSSPQSPRLRSRYCSRLR